MNLNVGFEENLDLPLIVALGLGVDGPLFRFIAGKLALNSDF